ncbi:MAG: ANTAR domain-containing response regulator [Armatimonadota bacterium]
MLKVLIAEDELILAYAMRGQLQQRGVEVVGLAANGRAAVERCQAVRPDVVLMDVRMPETDGIEATRRVMERCPTCVIIVTAFGDEETMARAEAAGAMGFLSKPIQAAGVLEAVPKARARFAEFRAIRAASRDLEEALAARCEIEAAKRVLVENGVSPETAFEVLRESARKAGASLGAMARRVVGGEWGGL